MKNVLITGCSRGLGAAIVQELLTRDCSVIPHFRSEGSYINLHKTPNIVLGDISEQSTINKIADSLREYDIDVYINNAAVYKHKSFTEYSEQDIADIININLTSQILAIQRVYDWFLEKGAGLIININSIAGIQPSPGETIYSATKHGMRGFSQSLQIESLGTNIRIVDIFPGGMKTDMTVNRDSFDQLIEPIEVSKRICNIVMSENITSLETEVVIRKFIQSEF